jgi:NAD(P)-dependent dehydrogenase (short-subunit alcohol dehydrogenase family)
MPSTLITGANRGIGFEFARQYLADGWQVYAACRDPDSASELRRLADDSDDKLQILALDVTDPVSVQAAAAKLDGQAIAQQCWHRRTCRITSVRISSRD